MKKNVVLSLLGLVLLVSAVAVFNMACAEKSSNRADIARKRVTPVLNSFLEPCGARVGSPVFLRAVKEDSVLELWVKPDKSECYMLAKRYPIAAWSGKLGPKEKEGDRQTPEGFYEVEPSGLNPRSNYHLSFNIGYPNAYDRSLNRTGSFIMVHGRDVSIGCLAMTDSGIEEIYTMVEQALVHGQKKRSRADLSLRAHSGAFVRGKGFSPRRLLGGHGPSVGLDGTDPYSGPGEGRQWQAGRCGAIKILRSSTGG